MLITLVIPVFNEQRRLPRSMALLFPFLSNNLPCDWEVVIADNGSTDKTFELGCALKRQNAHTQVVHLDQRGRGKALKHIWQSSAADILSYMDVDLSTDLVAFPKAIRVLAEQQFDLAIGSRLLPESDITRCWQREFISRAYNHLVRALFHTHFSDAQCGFKTITRSAARQLLPLVEDNQWFFDTELLILAEKLGYRIRDIPVKWIENPDSRVRLFHTIIQDLRGIIRLKRDLRIGKYSGFQRLSKYTPIQT